MKKYTSNWKDCLRHIGLAPPNQETPLPLVAKGHRIYLFLAHSKILAQAELFVC